jgi:hypothetical protein
MAPSRSPRAISCRCSGQPPIATWRTLSDPTRSTSRGRTRTTASAGDTAFISALAPTSPALTSWAAFTRLAERIEAIQVLDAPILVEYTGNVRRLFGLRLAVTPSAAGA